MPTPTGPNTSASYFPGTSTASSRIQASDSFTRSVTRLPSVIVNFSRFPEAFIDAGRITFPWLPAEMTGKLLPAQNLFPIHLNGLVISAFINTDLRGSCLQVFPVHKAMLPAEAASGTPFLLKTIHACLIYMFQKCFFSTFSDTATGSPDGVSGYELFFRLQSMDICV